MQAIWQELEARGEIYLGSFAGWYSVRDEAFYDESELVNGKAPTGADVEWVEEENFFFRLSAWQDRLLDLLRREPRFDRAARPAQRGRQLRQVGAARPLDIAHQLQLGDPGAGRPRHVIYVWLDALANYITALGYPDTETAISRISGRPIFTWSVRISCAFMRSIGRPS